MITKKRYFRFIALMLMASAFLPVLFNNLPPFIRSHHIWTILWSFSLFIFYPAILKTKAILSVVFYSSFVIISINTIWIDMDEWNKQALIQELYSIFIGVTVITYFYYNREYRDLAYITKWSIVFLSITAVMSIVSAIIDPMYARNIIGASSIRSSSEFELIMSYKKYGGGGYGTAIAFMGLIPVVLYYYKNDLLLFIRRKYIIIFIILLYMALLSMQIFANIVLVFAVLPLLIVETRNRNVTLFIILIFLIALLVIPKTAYIDMLEIASSYFNHDSDLNFKLRDLSLFLEGGNPFDRSTGAGARAERYPMLWDSFIQSPVFGCFYLTDHRGNGYMHAGGHLHWMNKLTVTGIAGLLIFSFVVFSLIKNQIRNTKADYRYFYFISIALMLGYGLFKAIAGREMWYTFFILLPGIYYLPLLNKKPK